MLGVVVASIGAQLALLVSWRTRDGAPTAPPWEQDVDDWPMRVHGSVIGRWEIAAVETDTGIGVPVVVCWGDFIEACDLGRALTRKSGRVYRGVSKKSRAPKSNLTYGADRIRHDYSNLHVVRGSRYW